jgi:hypothetical protein
VKFRTYKIYVGKPAGKMTRGNFDITFPNYFSRKYSSYLYLVNLNICEVHHWMKQVAMKIKILKLWNLSSNFLSSKIYKSVLYFSVYTSLFYFVFVSLVDIVPDPYWHYRIRIKYSSCEIRKNNSFLPILVPRIYFCSRAYI